MKQKERSFIKAMVGFQTIARYIAEQLPTSEVIQDALRKMPAYPEITIRELVANALIHRDLLLLNQLN